MQKLIEEGWERLPEGKDFIKGNLLLSLFRKKWHLFHLEDRKFLIERSEKFKSSDIKSLKP